MGRITYKDSLCSMMDDACFKRRDDDMRWACKNVISLYCFMNEVGSKDLWRDRWVVAWLYERFLFSFEPKEKYITLN